MLPAPQAQIHRRETTTAATLPHMAASALSLATDMWWAENSGARGLHKRRQSRLRSLIDQARSHSQFYQLRYSGVVPRTLSDLPPVTKSELMAAFDQWVCDPALRRRDLESFLARGDALHTDYRGHLVCSSSGTTGHPGIYVYDASTVAVFEALAPARIDRAWLRPRDWCALARRGMRWSAAVATGGGYTGEVWMAAQARRSQWHRKRYRTFSVQQPLPDLVRALNDFDPTILTAYATCLPLLAREKQAGRLRIQPILIESSAETLTEGHRRHVERTFNCPVRDVYATSEFQAVAIACRKGRLHVNSDWVILEPVDRNWQPVGPGVNSYTVLLTNLANRVQPLIRYDLGDSVRADLEPCVCGNPLPTITVMGRSDDVLTVPDASGRPVRLLPLAVCAVIEADPSVRGFQVEQVSAQTLLIRVDPASAAESAARELRNWLDRQNLGHVQVEVSRQSPRRAAQGGKLRQVIAQNAPSLKADAVGLEDDHGRRGAP